MPAREGMLYGFGVLFALSEIVLRWHFRRKIVPQTTAVWIFRVTTTGRYQVQGNIVMSNQKCFFVYITTPQLCIATSEAFGLEPTLLQKVRWFCLYWGNKKKIPHQSKWTQRLHHPKETEPPCRQSLQPEGPQLHWHAPNCHWTSTTIRRHTAEKKTRKALDCSLRCQRFRSKQ